MDELAERLDAVFAARTLGDLERPLADLPRAERDHHHLPVFARAPVLVLVALLVMTWALTGAGAFWPIWVLLGLWWFGPLRHGQPMGARPAQRAVAGSHARSSRKSVTVAHLSRWHGGARLPAVWNRW